MAANVTSLTTAASGASRPLSESRSHYDQEASFVVEEEVTLASIAKSHQIQFPVRSTYGSTWDAASAFRELVQNWRDGIVQSFNLSECQFDVVQEDQSTNNRSNIIFKVPNPKPGVPDDQSCLGYIRFFGTPSGGSVEIINRKAVLQPKHLYFGETSKTGRSVMAGTHGEGLKMALLVLMRQGQNHRVRCISGGFSWNFNFTTAGRLVARLNRLAASTLDKELDQARALHEAGESPFIVSPRHDIRFVIGEKGNGRDGFGVMKQRDPITLDAFNRWCKSALFLQKVTSGNQSIIKAPRGDLILENSLRGNLYLKGLLLQETTKIRSASISGKVLKFGYNFSHGETNRDRQSLFSLKQESQSIFNVWDGALAKMPNLVTELSEMLLSTDPEYADVVLAKLVVKPSTAIQLKNHLFSDTSKWYHSQEEGAKNPRLSQIIEGFGRQAFQLTDAYWEVLAKFNLARTAEEEQRKRFLNSRIAFVTGEAFPNDVHRLLQTCIRGCSQIAHVSIQFIIAGQLQLDTYYLEAEKVFKIHDKWLVKEEIMEDLGLANDVVETDILFHAVQWLFSELIEQLPANIFGPTDETSSRWHKRRTVNICTQRLLEYVRTKNRIMLRASPCEPNQLTVNWDASSSTGDDDIVTLQLHHEPSCLNLCCTLLASDFDLWLLPCINAEQETDEDVKPTQCFSVVVPAYLGTHCFDKLTSGSKYFAVLIRSLDPGSIVLASGVQEVPTARADTIDLTGADEPEDAIEDLSNLAPSSSTHQITQDRVSDGSISSNAEVTPTQSRHPSPPLPTNSRSPAPVAMLTSQAPGTLRPSATASLKVDQRSSGNAQSRNDSEESYRRGDPMSHLDILQPRDWFEARNHDMNGVIIGMPKKGTVRGFKRRRVDYESSESSARSETH